MCGEQMNDFLNSKFKKIIFIIIIIVVIEISGHGIFASLFRFLNSISWWKKHPGKTKTSWLYFDAYGTPEALDDRNPNDLWDEAMSKGPRPPGY